MPETAILELKDLEATEALGRRLGALLFPGAGRRAGRAARRRQDAARPRWSPEGAGDCRHPPGQQSDLCVDPGVSRPSSDLSLRRFIACAPRLSSTIWEDTKYFGLGTAFALSNGPIAFRDACRASI